MLRLPGRWAWDSWIVDDGERYHLFFLTAPATPDDPARRHTTARIWRATSTDLVEWRVHGEALGPAASGFDDLAVWTGSTVPTPDGRWRMFYTAIARGRHGIKDQRIGVAESDDLATWRRIGTDPVVAVDPARYKTQPGDPTASETWRDPFVFADPDGDGWHMLVTARTVAAGRNDDGVLAHARSADLQTWEVGAPVSDPAGFGQVEVPQVRVVDGRPLLVFTCHPDEQTAARVAECGQFCTWSVVGPAVTGPWDLTAAVPFTADPTLFAAPLVRTRDGGWALVGFHNRESAGDLDFAIADPVPVALGGGGLVAAGPART